MDCRSNIWFTRARLPCRAWWSYSRLVRLAFSSSTAGRLASGAPADLTIFDTERTWTYDVNKSASKSRNSPFHGRTFRGGAVATVVGGAFVWQAAEQA